MRGGKVVEEWSLISTWELTWQCDDVAENNNIDLMSRGYVELMNNIFCVNNKFLNARIIFLYCDSIIDSIDRKSDNHLCETTTNPN